MNKIKEVFNKGKAFIPFVTAGDPSLDKTAELILAMEKAGADLIEVGLPFSDPVAEGPVIQKASARALANGTTTNKIFAMLEKLRKQTSIPLAIMTYINPIFTYGTDLFMQHCFNCGVSAVIVPDLPFEEKDEIAAAAKKYGVAVISLIAPTSKDRITEIAKDAEGFVYCVSSLGVTGVRSEITTDIGEMVSLVKQANDIPCAVGFGISTPEQAAAIGDKADGVIVGSAIMRIIEANQDDPMPPVAEYVKSMKNALPK